MGQFGLVAARDWRSTERRKRSAAAAAPLFGQPGAELLGYPLGDAEPGRQARHLQLEHERSWALRSIRGRNAAPLKGRGASRLLSPEVPQVVIQQPRHHARAVVSARADVVDGW